jgi:prophage maintenance system killer protein
MTTNQKTNNKKIGLLFYTAGRFEGLKADAGSTIEFIETDDSRVLPSTKDVAILRDMKASWYSLQPNSDHLVTVNDYVEAHGSMLASTNAPVPGSLRSRPVRVSFAGGERLWTAKYAFVDNDLLENTINEALFALDDISVEEQAARLFFNIAKLQPFPDGNKRTAIIVANRMLLPDNEILLVPYENTTYSQFMIKLEDFYRDNIDLDEVGKWFSHQVKNVSDLDISMPYGEIIDLVGTTKLYQQNHLLNDIDVNFSNDNNSGMQL